MTKIIKSNDNISPFRGINFGISDIKKYRIPDITGSQPSSDISPVKYS